MRENKTRFSALIANISDVIAIIDPGGVNLYKSPNIEKWFGWKPEEVVGRSTWENVHPDDIEATLKVFSGLLGDTPDLDVRSRCRYRCKDGSYKWIEFHASNQCDNPDIGGILVNYHDITAQKAAEDTLMHSRYLLGYIIEHSRGAVAVLDRDMRYIYVSHRYIEECNVTEADIIGRNHYEVFPNLPDKWREVHKRALAGEILCAEDDPYLKADGTTEWTRWECRPWRESDGEIGGIIVYTEVTTHQKKMIDELERQNRFISTILDNLPIGLAVNEIGAGFATYMNRQFEKIYGWPRENLVNVEEFFKRVYPDPDYRSKIIAMVMAGLSSGDPAQMVWDDIEATGCDGTRRIVLAKNIPLLEQNLMISTVQDITGQKRALAELRRLATAIDQASEIVVITDPAGVIQYVNPAFERVTGYSREEALGKTPGILKSGKQNQEFYDELWETIAGGESWSGRFINRRKDGTHYTEEATISPVFNETGSIVNFVAVKNDITAQLSLEEQYRQAQKMESVGRLAGGVAHDFNNMLNVILGHAEMALEMLDPASPIFSDIKEIGKAARRSADLTRQLLAFARKQTISPRLLDLNATIAGMITMLRRLIGESVDLAWSPGPNLPRIKVDPSQLDQILANLSVNARDAVSGAGKISIRTSVVEITDDFCLTRPGFSPGRFVVLEVSDDGCGMSPEVMEHLFEPFFTTKDPGSGTGLGLATVYGIVKQNRAFIDVESVVGKGTIFKIFFSPGQTGTEIDNETLYRPGRTPKGEFEDDLDNCRGIDTAKAVPAEGLEQGCHDSGTKTILLVEDEPAMLNMGKRMLERIGCQVLPAPGPDRAIDIMQNHTDHIDLLMTDVIMPGMNGRELANRAKVLRPETRILFMSGYTADAIESQSVTGEGVAFIQKPFSFKGLSEAVTEILKAP